MITLLVLIASVLSGPPEDQIFHFPGFSGILPSDYYGGYLSVGDKNYYYMFTTAETNPESAPLVIFFSNYLILNF